MSTRYHRCISPPCSDGYWLGLVRVRDSQAKLISVTQNSITLQPIDPLGKGSYYDEITVSRSVSKTFDINYKGRKYSVTRKQFPISIAFVTTVQSIVGITLPFEPLAVFDNSRGTNPTVGYIMLSRKENSKGLTWIHDPEVKFDFKVDSVAKDTYDNLLKVRRNNKNEFIFSIEDMNFP